MAKSAATAVPMPMRATAAAVAVAAPAAAALKEAQSPAATSARETSKAFTHRHFIGGALGGMTAAIITSPLEVVKTRLQIKGASASLGNAKSLTTFGVMRSIRNTESVFGLWRGITPTLIGVIPARAIYFGAYSNFKESLKNRNMEGRVFNFLAAAGAGSISATLTCPIWVIKTRLQLMPAHTELVGQRQNVLSLGFSNGASGVMSNGNRPGAQFSSIRHLAMDMYRKEGPRAFFRGLSASYWGISESAIQYALYEEAKQFLGEPNAVKYFLAAGGCKLVAAALTYPHEVVRTRMRDQRAPMGSKELKYKSMIQSLRTIFKEEGVHGLYGGMPAHLMRVVPNAAIMFLVVEMVAASDE
uniref:Mitochondrial carrier protein n=1 Tax=Globisporangium ultimum (strain ATCC 200006 / CBS 805.95 / DAOM BR144) TaxID=431595 RepID=K3WJU6_GLOUD